ncbi:DRP3B [Symbiodinium natans]|uniref:DRP3B protein n=1 Tax=Symbiodinium natans TaxID=878477 RepID=A0A812KU52_9DINO|nr:DRP3B [Symbiodinium natans]
MQAMYRESWIRGHCRVGLELKPEARGGGGQGIPLEDHGRVQLMWTMITDYCEMFKNTIRGKYDRKLQRYMFNLPGGDSSSMSGGAHVRQVMNDFLADYLDVPMTAEMTDDDIDRAIRMHEGDSLPGFPSPDTFEYLALPHLQKISIPAVECVHNVASALDVLSQRMAQSVFRRFPKLAEVCLEMTANIIQEQKDKTRIVVEQQVACSVGYLFTNDPSYLTEHGSMEPMYEDKETLELLCQKEQKRQPPPPEEEKKDNKGPSQVAPRKVLQHAATLELAEDPTFGEKTVQQIKDNSSAAYQKMNTVFGLSLRAFLNLNSLCPDFGSPSGQKQADKKNHRYSGPFVKEIRKRLDSYLAITVRNVRDAVPKAIGFYLVRAVQDKLQFELLNALNQKDKISELLGEPSLRQQWRAL